MAGVGNLKPFKKGQSGNPGGRPKGIAEKARVYADQALNVLAECLGDEDAKVRIAASRELLDRGFGKAIAMTADLSKKLDDMNDDTLDAAIDVLRAAISASAQVDDGKDSSRKH